MRVIESKWDLAKVFLNCWLLLYGTVTARTVEAQEKPASELATASQTRFPGPTANGYLLPNGWHITPAGRQVETSDLVLNIIPFNDSKHAVIATSGFNEHNLAVINIETGSFVAKESVYQSWFGLALTSDEKKLFWSGGGAGRLHTFDLANGQMTRTSEREPDVRSMKREEVMALKAQLAKDKSFRSGLCLDEERQCVYSLKINSGILMVTPFETGESKELELGGRPYDVQVSPRNKLLYVSDWSERRILVVDPVLLRIVARIPVGEHPNQLAFHPTDDRLFVACASSNGVWVVDTRRGIVSETIFTGLFPRSPEGSTPDALALSPDGTTLFVANADNNSVAVVDVTQPNRSIVKGFIPTGWYPTSIAVTPDGKNLLIGVGKGNQSKANPISKFDAPEDSLTETEKAVKKVQPFPYIGTIMSGALSIVSMPDDAALQEYTQQVYRNCPYSDELLTAVPSAATPHRLCGTNC
jgi:YVTN family beta-propeller protein